MRNLLLVQFDVRKDRGDLVQSCYPRPPSKCGIARIVSVLSVSLSSVGEFAPGSLNCEIAFAAAPMEAYLEKVGTLLGVACKVVRMKFLMEEPPWRRKTMGRTSGASLKARKMAILINLHSRTRAYGRRSQCDLQIFCRSSWKILMCCGPQWEKKAWHEPSEKPSLPIVIDVEVLGDVVEVE